MRNVFISLALLAATATPAFAEEALTPEAATPVAATAVAPAASVVASRGQQVVAANGARMGRVSRLADDGSPQLIVEGKLVTVPLSSLSIVDGRLVSTLSPGEIADLS
jgi:hypothetical protein